MDENNNEIYNTEKTQEVNSASASPIEPEFSAAMNRDFSANEGSSAPSAPLQTAAPVGETSQGMPGSGFGGYSPANSTSQNVPPRAYSPYANEAPRAAYTDAGYRPSSQAAPTPNYYGYMGQSYAPSKKELRAQKRAASKAKRAAKKATRRGMSPLGIVALCLACVILGSAGGVITPRLINSYLPSSGTEAEQGTTVREQAPTVINQASGANIITNTVESVGGTLSGSQIYELGSASTVAITTEITYTTYFGYTQSGSVSGSGFVISSDGYIITNHHVIEDAANGNYDVKVLFLDGKEYLASIVGYDEDNDIAVLKIEADNLIPVTIGDSSSISVGESVYAIGNPLGTLEFTQTTGTVSALNREITSYDSSTGVYNSINMFQIDAAVNSGNSGGPVFNSRGEVIGVVTAKYSDSGVEGLGFAIPINDAVKIAKDLITDGYVRGKAALGIEAVTVSKSAAAYYNMVQGVYVSKITEGSCAEIGGLKVGDVIIAIDGTETLTMSDLIAAKKNYSAGDTAVLRVNRSGEELDITVTFDEEVPSEGDTQATMNQQSGSTWGGSSGSYGYGNGGSGSYGYGFGNMFP